MPKKRSQGLSITTVVVAVIALIVIVVVVAMLTGKLGIFSSGTQDISSCENTCERLGRVFSDGLTKEGCRNTNDGKGIIPPGTFEELSGTVCCCVKP